LTTDEDATVTLTTADVVWLPAASRARAARICAPVTLDAFHIVEYGAVVSSAPYGAPSTRNCTPTTPTLSDAVAVNGTEPPGTVEPFAGAVIDTTGGVKSLLTVTVTAVEVVLLPAASRATAVNVWVPLATVVVSHVIEGGLVVSSAPRLLPSSLNCTPATPTSSDALAVTVIVPETVAPSEGAVIETVGGVLSAVTTALASFEAGERLPAASSALTT
jgi:hypothetical protein